MYFMSQLKFQKLTPIDNVELDTYEEALDFVFSEKDILNIAISGAYGSGKSSILNTYEKKHKELTFIHISLAHFDNAETVLPEQTPKELVGTGEKTSIKSEEPSIESRIEGKILNQLIQQIPSKKIPQTNFHKKRTISKWKPLFFTIVISLLVMCSLYLLTFDSINPFIKDNQISNWIIFNPAFIAICFLLSLGYIIYCFVNFQYKKGFIKKITLKGNEIELFSEEKDSFFDKYLNEVLYLFENCGADAIIFEDIDRFENTSIFERLREINALANIRLEKKSLRFFYLLRDDVFNNKDRSKFFDFIIPIVPVVDSSNSYNKIKDYLIDCGQYQKFDDHFLRGVSLYIDDFRVLKNIYNEYLIYKDKLDKIELKSNNLFALMVYKNLFPQDFANLQLCEGFVYHLFTNKNKLIEEITIDAQEKIEKLTQQIEEIDNEHLEKIEELDIIDNEKNPNKYSHSSKSLIYSEYTKWKDTDYVRRKKIIEQKNEYDIQKLENAIVCYKQSIEKVKNQSLSDLLDRKNIGEYFKNTAEEFAENSDIINNKYFDLLKYLISRRYIDETYSDYMSYFYPNSLTINDKTFLRSVTDRKAKEFSYRLDSPELVLESLEEYDFSQKETLNFELCDYILKLKGNNYINALINQIMRDKRFDFISGYIMNRTEISKFVHLVIEIWPTFFKEAYLGKHLSEDLLKRISYEIISTDNQEVLKLVNEDDYFSNFISNIPDYLSINDIDIRKFIANLSILNIKFTSIDTQNINEALFDKAYEEKMYTINQDNINLMLEVKCNGNGFELIKSNFLTFVFANKEEYYLCAYLLANINETIGVYFNMMEGKISDSNDVVVSVLNNNDISEDNKFLYISKLSTKVSNLSEVKSEKIKSKLIKYMLVEYKLENILDFYDVEGLSDDLINFINSEKYPLEYHDIDESYDLSNFIDSTIKCNEICDDKYKEFASNLFDSIEEFSLLNLSRAKLSILISLNLIIMNSKNLKFIRNEYSDGILEFIISDVDEYINIATGTLSDIEEIRMLLDSLELSVEQKLDLLSTTTQPISIKDKQYEDGVTSEIIINHLDVNDLPIIIKMYDEASKHLQNSILTVLEARLTTNIDMFSLCSNNLITTLMNSKKLEFDDKVLLLSKTANKFNLDDLCTIIRINLNAEKISDVLKGEYRRIVVNTENEAIVNALVECKIIEQPGKTEGGHYQKIKIISNEK